MRRFSLHLTVIILLAMLALSSCQNLPTPIVLTPTPAVELTETHVFAGFGYSIDYPAGWLAETRGAFTAISELEEDHRRAFIENAPVEGYQVGLDHQRMTFMRGLGLPNDPSLQDLLALNTEFFELQEPMEVSETVIFGVPALSVKAHSESVGWGFGIMGFVNDEAFLLSLSAPSEEALDEFRPTWNRMLESIEPVEK